jgi:flagellar biogenesis protein FliO
LGDCPKVAVGGLDDLKAAGMMGMMGEVVVIVVVGGWGLHKFL